ncbi:hypothetical protein CMI39_00335 [Candidatus Pacearchaeota archaeon]|jgi:hypothetical protein|nr:hypothetical protein [Candidatus Pacearchaeota archaeon]|tara:strand:+ start:2212 stop:2550 length:339 start_codon:yes stop_codon:yes gene_type:complete
MENYKGKVKFIRLSGKTHVGPYSNSERVPIVSLGLVDKKLKEFEMPMNIFGFPNDGSSFKWFKDLEKKLIDQKVSYKSEFERGQVTGEVWNLEILSGELKGMEYKLDETTDW